MCMGCESNGMACVVMRGFCILNHKIAIALIEGILIPYSR